MSVEKRFRYEKKRSARDVNGREEEIAIALCPHCSHPISPRLKIKEIITGYVLNKVGFLYCHHSRFYGDEHSNGDGVHIFQTAYGYKLLPQEKL